jgi:hypothetical protein
MLVGILLIQIAIEAPEGAAAVREEEILVGDVVLQENFVLAMKEGVIATEEGLNLDLARTDKDGMSRAKKAEE